MKTTRRDFLKGLFATGATLAVAPRLLVELVHGASDLTPQERDVAAEAMGLRQRLWPGYGPSPTGLSVRITNAEEGEIVVSGFPSEHWFDAQRYLQGAPDGMIVTDRKDDWEFEHGYVVFPDAKRDREILYGVPGGEMPTGIIRMNPDGRPRAGQISACMNTEASNREQAPPADMRDLIGDIADGELHIKFTESKTGFNYKTYPVYAGTDRMGNQCFDQITLSGDMPEQEVKAILEARSAQRYGLSPISRIARLADADKKIAHYSKLLFDRGLYEYGT